MIEIYIYPCSVCETEYKWSEPQPKHGKTCPSCRDKMFDKLIAWGEDQRRDEESLHEQMDKWWDNLPEDVREKAFFSIVKRLNKYDAIEDLSYRRVLEKFGFDSNSYYMGIICGFMNLHNCIVPQSELSKMRSALRTQKLRDEQIRESFRIKSTCKWCGYQSMDLNPGSMCPMVDCEGGME